MQPLFHFKLLHFVLLPFNLVLPLVLLALVLLMLNRGLGVLLLLSLKDGFRKCTASGG